MNFRLVESKQDIEKFEKIFGDGSYDEFQSIKARIPGGTEYVSNLTGAVVNNPKDITSIEKSLGGFGDIANQEFSAFIKYYKELKTKSEEREEEKAGAKLVFENKETGDRIYHVTTPKAMRFYGRNTTWCLAGKYPGHEDEQIYWWNHYLNETDGGYYVLITKENKKFCFNYDGTKLNRVTNTVNAAGNGNDDITYEVLNTPMFNPDVYEFFNVPIPKDWSEEIYYWNGNASVPNNVCKVVILDGVTCIQDFEFANKSSLLSIEIPSSVSHIGVWAFEFCTSLQSIVIPNGVQTIDDYTFSKCASLRSVTIPNSVNRIKPGAFYHCASLQSITIPNSVAYIEEDAFSYCTSLRSITLPDGVTTIETCTFRGCESLQSITIPEGVIDIHQQAFDGCSSLKSITIPSSVTNIEIGAFNHCGALEEITLSEKLYKKILSHPILLGINPAKIKVKFNDKPTNESLNESYSDQAQKIYSYITNIMKNRQDISNWSYDDYHIEPDWAGSGMRIQVEFDVKPNADSKSICREIMNNIEDYFYGVNCSIGFGRDWDCYFTIHVDEKACR